MAVVKQYKDYKIVRHSWWKFWEIDRLEFSLPSVYQDAYEEVEVKTFNGTQLSMELRPWVIEDVRQQLGLRIKTYEALTLKAKKLSVKIHTDESGQRYYDGLQFYIRAGQVYFDSDNAIKREKLLNKLGIC